MRVASTQKLLAAWEHGRAAPRPAHRALALLSAADSDLSRDTVSRLTVGARDRLLLALRRDIFGPRLNAVTICPGCRSDLEMEFDTEAISVISASETELDDANAPLSISRDGYHIVFRLPNSADLLALPEQASIDQARQHLIERVMLRASRGDEEIATTELPQALLDALDERMSLADPQADVRLNLSCAGCGANWQAPFDIVSYFWSEVEAWAMALLRDVHRLARAYSWREADILALSASRRQCYLDMLDE